MQYRPCAKSGQDTGHIILGAPGDAAAQDHRLALGQGRADTIRKHFRIVRRVQSEDPAESVALEQRRHGGAVAGAHLPAFGTRVQPDEFVAGGDQGDAGVRGDAWPRHAVGAQQRHLHSADALALLKEQGAGPAVRPLSVDELAPFRTVAVVHAYSAIRIDEPLHRHDRVGALGNRRSGRDSPCHARA